MISFSEFWKLWVLAIWMIIVGPVFVPMGGTARGANTPGGVPIGTQAGQFVDLGGGVAGSYAYRTVLFDDADEWIIAIKAPANLGVPPQGAVWGWILPGRTLVALSYEALQNPGNGIVHGMSFNMAGGLPTTINGKNLVLEMLRAGKMFDVDKDGDIDGRDVNLFLEDMDQDGILNEDDADADGDGENNFAESVEPESATATSYKQFDPGRFPDRDGDGMPDLLDKDNDGWANWIEKIAGTSATNALEKPSDAFQLQFEDAAGNVLDQAIMPDGFWPDTDGDGMYDWLEAVFNTDENDPYSFRDSNGDGHWDWNNTGGGTGIKPVVPVVPPGPDPAVPQPPIANPPITPTLMGGSGQGAGGATDGGAAGGAAGNGPTNGNTVDSTGNPGEGSAVETPEPPEPSPSGTGTGMGNYQVHVTPRGNSTAYMGVGGGTWGQRAGPNHQYLTGTAHDAMASKSDTLVNAIRGVQVTGHEAHIWTFPVKWWGGTTKNFTIRLLPDTSTEWGAIAESVRVFLRAVALVFVTYVLIRSVWLVLRQY